MTSRGWFSVDARAHMRKLADFHYHHPGGFILDLIRGGIKRGARRIRVELAPGCVCVADNGPPPSRQILDSLQFLAKPGIGETRLEQLIHELLDPPGIGWLAVFASSPQQVTIRVRREGQWKRTDLYPVLKDTIEKEPLAVMMGMNTVVDVRAPGSTLPCTLSWLRESCHAANAGVEVNRQLVKRGHLLPNTFLARQLRDFKNTPAALMALPENGETCRVVLTDAGIPWEEMNLPPIEGLVFHLQLEHPHPPGVNFISPWVVPARRLYNLAAGKFSQFPPDRQCRLEELFFHLFRQSGDDSLFRNAAIFAVTKTTRRFSLAEVESLAAQAPLLFRLRHNHMPETRVRKTPVLHLTSLQLDFLKRKGLPLRQAPDPVILQDPKRVQLHYRLLEAVVLLTRLRFCNTRPIPLEQLTNAERALVTLLSDSLSRPGPGSQPGKLPPVWNPIILDRRAWIPMWPGVKLGPFNFRDLVFARRHPDFQSAARRLQRNPTQKDLICAAFRLLVRNTGVQKNKE